MDHLNIIANKLAALRTELTDHRVYSTLRSIDDIRTFMEMHVFAVWDFMSLLKALQMHLTCTTVPWQPVKNAKTARFINEIVLGEETDVNRMGVPKSHFEMYLDAMDELGANTRPIQNLVQACSSMQGIPEALEDSNMHPAAAAFVHFTFNTISSKQTHKIASAFTFGREDLIPDMFLNILHKSNTEYPEFEYYLNRHIEIDGDEHGPLSLAMIKELCGDDEIKWQDVLASAASALEHRIELWDAIADEIENRTYTKIPTGTPKEQPVV